MAQVLAGQGQLQTVAIERLGELLVTTDYRHAATSVAEVLAGQSELPATVVGRLGDLAEIWR